MISICKYKDSQVLKIDSTPGIDSRLESLSGYRVVKSGIIVELSPTNVKKLKHWEYKLSQNVINYLNNYLPINIPKLKGKLRKFQNIGVRYLENNDGNGIIADEMGLGKTIQAIAFLQLHPELRPAIIVCPSTPKLNWKQELLNWSTVKNIQVLFSKKKEKLGKDIIIVSYNLLANTYKEIVLPNGFKIKKEVMNTGLVDHIIACNPKIVIFDECHYLKNSTSNRTKSCKKLAKSTPHIIGLSGTPIEKRPVEIDNIVRMIQPNLLPPFQTTAIRYYDAKNNGFGWDYTGASNKSEFHKLLTTGDHPVMLRRLKKDVLKELPPKQFRFVPLEIDNKTDYVKAEKEFINYLKETEGESVANKAKKAASLSKVNTLLQISSHGKLTSVIEWIREFLESGEKLVVFATHSFVIDFIMKEFKKEAVKIDGSVSTKHRQDIVNRFQNDPKTTLFVGQIIAAGEAITLTAASNCAIIELPNNPAKIDQAADRVHRLGQKWPVTIHYLLAADTIDYKMAKLLDAERLNAKAVMDGVTEFTDDVLSRLMKMYK